MPEQPEIYIIARQMHEKLAGLSVKNIEAFQPKCLNHPVEDYKNVLIDHKIIHVSSQGKWIKVFIENDLKLYINLGMGGEICHYTSSSDLPEKKQFLINFDNNEGLFVSFWWFGYVHLVLKNETHKMTEMLGPDAFEMSQKEFRQLFLKRKGKIKSFLLNQKNISGIGNFYIQEILFDAKLHPDRTIPTLSSNELEKLYHSIHKTLKQSIDLGSSEYELDYLGKKGKYGLNQLAFAYQEDALCPECGTVALKIKTGTNSQYICPACQKK